ncbi:D-sedoheptulose-7-phosphate isomerase [Neobacillus ginsengisoli]|uniref:D-sedoheptulose 7-phosphate isomerase n=1 Tax=Neobacillus ginsengisoli TaxID=904295 RepID=A0ABT9XY47_9BACI|nr:SIS domain-containing protein [Neobacillus ginsengisoli]MDQ0200296.1 D-sedoheptulose 7-phosphate isomerase [Neobacillus ginsengisoli]
MRNGTRQILDSLIERYPPLFVCKNSIESAFNIFSDCYVNNGKLLICGNGGSAADAEHIVGELMKGFMHKRPISNRDRDAIFANLGENAESHYLINHLQSALPAISLVSHSALMTAFNNDVQPDLVFAQQVYGYGRQEDVVVGLSTSGNSKNVVYAMKIAKAFGLKTVALTGQHGGELKEIVDACICVPANSTPIIQEYHLPVYHVLCMMVESEEYGVKT